MPTKPYELRRRCNVGGIEYLLDDDDGTAWLHCEPEGRYNGTDSCILPEEVDIGGRTYRITSVMGEFSVPTGTLVQELIIPDSYENIEELGFRESFIETIHIGRGLRWFTVWSCYRLSPDVTITISSENPHIKMSDDGNCILTKDGKRLISVVREVPELTVPEGVEIIRTQGLSDNRDLQTIDLPSTLRQLDGEAFADDNCLKKIIVRAIVPPLFNGGLDQDLTRLNACHLVVPRPSLPTYRNHTDWGWFLHIDILEDYD